MSVVKGLNKIIQDGADRGLLHQFTSSKKLDSAEVEINGEEYLNFGSCSYLGLEFHEDLKEGVKQAVDAFGTQFSTSRTYLSVGLYDQLEAELQNMFNKPALVSASTTLGHLAALPTLINENDIVILDFQVHSSVQMAAKMLKAQNISVQLVPHNDMESLEAKIKSNYTKANRIWYLADGVYSMYGDYSPLDKLEALLNKYSKFHLYIDDAHGMGWTGENGVGYVRSKIKHHDKMVLITSLNKSFASGGGVMIFPNKEWYQLVKNCGTTLIFSGPIQPPMLGAAIASAKLHQSAHFSTIQDELKNKVAYTNKRLKELDLPQYMETDSPLFFIPVGLPQVIRTIVKRMKKKGFYINSASFPATPMKKGGLRFMISNNLSIDQIEAMLATLQKEYLFGLIDEGSSPAEVAKTFKIDNFLSSAELDLGKKPSLGLKVEIYNSILDLDKKSWDKLFYQTGTNSFDNLLSLENTFKDNLEKENNWRFKYYIVRDRKNEIILASVCTTAIMMEDLLSDATLSDKVKEIRKNDPYYLTSPTIISGSPFTKGKSLYVNYESEDWKESMKAYIGVLINESDENNVSKVVLRDFSSDDKLKLEPEFLELGLLELELPKNCVINNANWKSDAEFQARLGQKYRYSLRKEILKYESEFRVDYSRPTSKEDQTYIIKLYQEVYKRASTVSVFELPDKFFKSCFEDESYDFISLYSPETEKPIAVMISQIIDNVYYALLVGLNYDFEKNDPYKQILYQAVKRANALGCEHIDLAYTAEMTKKKVGAKAEGNYGYLMSFDMSAHAELELLN